MRIRNIVPLSISKISLNKIIDILKVVGLNSTGFQTFRPASRTIKEIKTIHAIYKQSITEVMPNRLNYLCFFKILQQNNLLYVLNMIPKIQVGKPQLNYRLKLPISLWR